MQLTVWTYEGPPHIGAIRIAASMRGVHLVLHAPQGDTYADLLFTMIERRNTRPPVTYTTFQARDLGADTAEIFKTACREAVERFAPDVVLVGASCTAELIQDNPAGLAAALNLAIPVVSLELPSYQKKENWGAAETFYRLVRTFAPAPAGVAPLRAPGKVCNILGPASLGFRHRDDIVEVTKLVESLGLTINVVAPLGAGVDDLARIPAADFNIVLYPEIAGVAAEWLKRSHGQPFVALPPIGALATEAFVAAVGKAAGLDPAIIPAVRSRLPWYSRSVDSTYLTASGSSSSAMRPMPSPLPMSPPRNSASPSVALAPTAANMPARFARRRPSSASRRSSPTITWRWRRRSSPPSRNWCSARKWSGMSRSGCASPARSSPRPSMSRISRRATRRRWASRAPMSCSIPGSIR